MEREFCPLACDNSISGVSLISIYLSHHLHKVAVELLAFRLCIWEVLGSDLRLEMICRVEAFMVFLSPSWQLL
jgi:hypothetical protein